MSDGRLLLPLERAAFSQRTYSSRFSEEGDFSGRSVDEVAAALRAGDLQLSDVSVGYVERGTNVLVLNTRSAIALELAGIPRSAWHGIDHSGDPFYEGLLTRRLARNRLTDVGILVVRRTGG